MNSSAQAESLSRLDRWGMVVSGACIVHCLALPLASALLPFVAVALPHEEWVHPLLLGLALPVTGFALLRGYRRHRRRRPLFLGSLGLALIASAIVIHTQPSEAILSVSGGLLVVCAHLMNWRRHRPNGSGRIRS